MQLNKLLVVLFDIIMLSKQPVIALDCMSTFPYTTMALELQLFYYPKSIQLWF